MAKKFDLRKLNKNKATRLSIKIKTFKFYYLHLICDFSHFPHTKHLSDFYECTISQEKSHFTDR